MKKKTVFILLTLALLLCLCPSFASAGDASGQCGEDLYWSFDSSTGALTITGSGSAVFGVFRTAARARTAFASLAPLWSSVFLASTCEESMG